MYNYKIGWCYICGQGWVVIAKTKNDVFLCCCDECESVWKSPQHFLQHKSCRKSRLQFQAVDIDDNDILPDYWKDYIL